MEPICSPGDYVGGQLFPAADLKLLIGKNCIVRIPQHLIMCRRLSFNKNGHFELRIINLFTDVEHAILQNIEITAAAPVTRVWRQLKIFADDANY